MNNEWAVIVSGQPRGGIYESYDDYKDMTKYFNNIDTFCHFMKSENFLTGFWHTQNAQIWPIDLTLKLWNPKDSKIERYEDFDFKNISNFRASGGMSMTYGIKKAFELLKDYESKMNFNYKYVMKWRYDLLLHCSDDINKRNKQSNNRYDDPTIPLFGKFKEPYLSQSCDFWDSNNNHRPDTNLLESIDDKIDWEYITSKLDEGNTIFVSPGWNWGHPKACCDLFLLGSRDAMEKYSNYHDKYMDLILRPDCYENNEAVLGTYLKDICGIRVLNYYFADIGQYR